MERAEKNKESDMTAREELDKQERIDQLTVLVTSLQGDIIHLEGRLGTANEQLGLRDADIDGRAREQRELSEQLTRLNTQLESTVVELEQLRVENAKLKDEDGAEKEERVEQVRQEARLQTQLDEQMDRRRAGRYMAKSQFFLAAIMGILTGLFFLFGKLFWGWFPGWPVVIGTIAGIMILVGLIPQIVELMNRILPQLEVHKYVAVILPAVAIGLTIALLGVPFTGGWTWFLAFLVTLVGYALLVIFETWGIATLVREVNLEESDGEQASETSVFTILLCIISVVTIFSFIIAFFARPLTRILGDVQVESIYGPALHLADTLLTTIGVMALIGLSGVVVWFGVKVFASLGLLFKKQISEMRRYTLWDWVSMMVLLMASVLVGILVVVGLWPMDSANTIIKVVAVIIGVLSCVGFGLIKAKLLKAGRTPDSPWFKVFLLSFLIVLTTGYVSLGTLYKAASQKERFNALISRVHAQESNYFNLTSGQAMRFAKAAEKDEQGEKYTKAVEGMKVEMAKTLEVTNNRKLRKVVTRFQEHGSVLAIVDELAPAALNKVKVPPEPSANALLAHVFGFSKAPRGVERKYTGALVKAFAAWTLAEFMVLIVFFILLALRGKQGGELDDDGHIVSDMRGDGTRFLVYVRQGAAHVNEGDQATVFNGGEKIVGSLEYDKAMGDGVVLMSRRQANTDMGKGDSIRFV
jgi:hypothetical protein